MTIKQMAAKHNVSPQAIYQRLKKQGVNVNTLMDKETQELSPEGEMILDKLFDKKSQPLKANSTAFADEQRRQISELRAENASQAERIKSLEKENAALIADKEYLKQALDKAQANQTETLKLLPGSGGGADRRSFWQRITGKGKT